MSKLKQRILTVAIAIMLVLFIGFGIDTFYKPPKYENYCKNQYAPVLEKTGSPVYNSLSYDSTSINNSFRLCSELSDKCIKSSPSDSASVYKCLKEKDDCSNDIMVGYLSDKYRCMNETVQTQSELDSCNEKKGYLTARYDNKGCVESYTCETCQNTFQEADKKYNGIVFIVALVLGIICMIIAIVLKNDTVSPGVLGGGFLSILYGTIRDWSNLGDYLRLALLGVALAILIWIGYKKMTVDDELTTKKKKR